MAPFPVNDRSHAEEMFWLGFVDGEEPEEAPSPLLPHLTDQDIRGLGDSYDDGRIDTLVEAYVQLRKRVISAIKVLDLDEE